MTVSASILGLGACGPSTRGPTAHSEPPASVNSASGAASGTAASSPSAVASVSTVPLPTSTPVPCGALNCRLLDQPDQALAFVLASNPRVLAVGEAHAPKGAAARSATGRFTKELLPLLRGRASDLVLELLVAPSSCKAAADVEKLQAPVVDPQADTNQAEYLGLRDEAEQAGIRAHLLEPKCQDYEAAAREGANSTSFLLVLIEALTEDRVGHLLDQNEKQGSAQLVVTYGGAMHNDLTPRAEIEPYSFGPPLAARTQGAYVELDLIVPEFIKDTESWRTLPWYSQFKRLTSSAGARSAGDTASPSNNGDKVTLYQTAPSSFALIFDRTPPK